MAAPTIAVSRIPSPPDLRRARPETAALHRRRVPARLALLGAVAAVTAHGPLSGQAAADGPAAAAHVIRSVREGGVIVVCRHAITGSFREREPVDYDDPTTQRRLSTEGERQAEAMGEALRALDVDLAEVRASPMARARRTAELMVGPGVAVAVDSAWHTNGGAYDGPARERRRALLATPVARGVRLVVSHIGTMRSVLGAADRVEEGDCVVVRPGDGDFEELGVVRWSAWLEATGPPSTATGVTAAGRPPYSARARIASRRVGSVDG